MFLYHDSFLFEKIDNGVLRSKKQKARDWHQASAILKQIPLHVHLLCLYDEKNTSLYSYRKYYMNALEGNLATKTGFTIDIYVDFLYQITFGINALHSVGIFHQDLRPENLWVRRSNQYCSGYLIVIGGFERSGPRIVGQSPLNPRRPNLHTDLNLFYKLGVLWKIPDWPQYESFEAYQAWLWMQPCGPCGSSNATLLYILNIYSSEFASIKRIEYILRCKIQGKRLLNAPPAQIYSTDAELLDVVSKLHLHLQKRPQDRRFLSYEVMDDLFDLVNWESPDCKLIEELRLSFKNGGGNSTAKD